MAYPLGSTKQSFKAPFPREAEDSEMGAPGLQTTLQVICPLGPRVSTSSQAATTQDHRLGGLNSRHLFLMVLEAGSLRSRCREILFSVRALFLAYRRPPSCCVLPCQRKRETEIERERERKLQFLPLFIKTLILSWGLYPQDLI